MSALGIGTFSVKDTLFAPVVAAFASICSYLWFRVNLGSKFWQESWEVEVNLLAKEQKIRAFERPMKEVREQVRASLLDGWKDERHSWLQRWVDAETTKKFSVTYHMILLFSRLYHPLGSSVCPAYRKADVLPAERGDVQPGVSLGSIWFRDDRAASTG